MSDGPIAPRYAATASLRLGRLALAWRKVQMVINWRYIGAAGVFLLGCGVLSEYVGLRDLPSLRTRDDLNVLLPWLVWGRRVQHLGGMLLAIAIVLAWINRGRGQIALRFNPRSLLIAILWLSIAAACFWFNWTHPADDPTRGTAPFLFAGLAFGALFDRPLQGALVMLFIGWLISFL